MSHYVDEILDITDAASIVKALKALGFTDAEIHQQRDRQLRGYQNDKRKNTADITLDRSATGGASNDIGFKKQKNGKYNLIISEYDRTYQTYASGTKGDRFRNFAVRFKKEYTKRTIKKQMNTKAGRGWRYSEKKVGKKTQIILTQR